MFVLFTSLLLIGSMLSLHTLNESFGLSLWPIIGLIISLLGIGGLLLAKAKKASWPFLSTIVSAQVILLLIVWPLVRFGLPLIISMHGGDASALLTQGLKMPTEASTIIPLALLPAIAIVLVALKNRVFHSATKEENFDE